MERIIVSVPKTSRDLLSDSRRYGRVKTSQYAAALETLMRLPAWGWDPTLILGPANRVVLRIADHFGTFDGISQEFETERRADGMVALMERVEAWVDEQEATLHEEVCRRYSKGD